MRDIKISIHYSGGEADNNRLELYDGTLSFHGVAQSLQIALHALLNGEIVSRATALKNSTLYVTKTRKESFIFEIVAFIEKYPAMTTISTPIVLGFLKHAYSLACGKDSKIEHPKLKKQFERREPFFDELAEVMEGSLQRAHKPIEGGIKKISISGGTNPIITLDKNTKEWVDTNKISESTKQGEGNVTRYNVISGNGRLYLKSKRKIVPFRLSAEFPELKKQVLTWSLHE
jgi:hypothetical protein